MKTKFAICFAVLMLFISANVQACDMATDDYANSVRQSQGLPPLPVEDKGFTEDTLALIGNAKTIFVGEVVGGAMFSFMFQVTHVIKNTKEGQYYTTSIPPCSGLSGVGATAMVADKVIFEKVSIKAAEQIKKKYGFSIPVLDPANNREKPKAPAMKQEDNSSYAQAMRLAKMNGKNVDYVKMLQQAAREGDRRAPLLLAHVFWATPQGIAQDHSKSYFWLKVANLSGDIAAEIPVSWLGVSAEQKTALEKDAEKWINMPAGSRPELPDPITDPPREPSLTEKTGLYLGDLYTRFFGDHLKPRAP